MGEVFLGWKRKVGCLTLLLACLLGTGWARSLRINEQAHYNYSEQILVFVGSGDGLICFGRSHAETPLYTVRSLDWWSDPLTQDYIDSSRNDFRWIWQFLGAEIGVRKTLPKGLDENVIVRLPYWLFVIPLTLVSAYLLLAKPRKSIPKQIPEAISCEGVRPHE